MNAPTFAELLDNWEILGGAVVTSLVAGLLLGWLSIHIVVRKTVFVAGAVSQASALGVALSFLIEIQTNHAVDPLIGAVVCALIATATLSLRGRSRLLTTDNVLGGVYAVAAAGVVLVGEKISQEAHDIQAILFGSAVLVDPVDAKVVAVVSVSVLLIHLWLRRAFIFAGFDPIAARVQRVPVFALDAILWCTIAVSVAAATRAIGALPVFVLSFAPGVAALALMRNMTAALICGAGVGAFAGGAGYVAAFLLDWPVGATQSVLALALAAIMSGLGSLLARAAPR